MRDAVRPTPPVSTKDPTPSVKRGQHDDDDDDASQQWVFAKVTGHDMVDEMDAERVVARQGERVMLVYPMRSDPNTGRVTMRAKTVDAVTGQLSYAWVLVYDPEAGSRAVTDFSLW